MRELPFVSVIVPVKAEESYISECVDSLLKQSYQRQRYEIIVVMDKNATSGVRNALKRYDGKIMVAQSKKPGSAANRNLGARLAGRKSKYLAFTDADCIADRRWLRKLVERIEKAHAGVGCVGGLNLVPKSDNGFAKIVGAIEQTLLGGGGSAQSSISKKERYVNSIPNCNALYRKELWRKNSQDESLIIGQDGEFNYRLGLQGNRFIVIPGAAVWHHRTKSFFGYVKRMYKYGEATAKILRKHPEFSMMLSRWYAFAALAGFFAIIALSILSFYSITASCILVSIALLYAILDIMTSISVIKKLKRPYSLISLALLPLQHLLYVIGFIKGFLSC